MAPTRRTRFAAAVALATTAVVGLVGTGLPDADGSPTGDPAAAAQVPALGADAPDPDAVVLDDGSLVVLTTNADGPDGPANVPARTWSRSGGWSWAGDALPLLGRWARPGRTWAPGLARLPDGRWHLWYTAWERASGRQCIGHAVGDEPTGPFTDPTAGPVVCDRAEGGSIDPDVTVGPDGTPWLTWKSDANRLGRASTIKSVRLTATGAPTGAVATLLRADRPADRLVVENPTLVHDPRAGWVLLVSTGGFAGSGYATATATCASPAGPCRRGSAPALETGGGLLPALVGPGGAVVAVDRSGTSQLVLHAWDGAVGYRAGGRRALVTAPVDLATGTLRLRPERAPIGRPDVRPTWTMRTLAAPVPADLSRRFGAAGGTFVACDLDGDGVDTPVWVAGALWHRADLPATHPASRSAFGAPGDVPLCADVDGDGRDERAVRRGAVVLVDRGTSAAPLRIVMGRADDRGLLGDWDGDGRADPGIVRDTAADGVARFVLRPGPGPERRFAFGPVGAPVVVGDWDGDGDDDVGIRIGTELRLRLDVGPPVVVDLGSLDAAPVAGRWVAGAPADGVGVVER